jgi:hypothetical protein
MSLATESNEPNEMQTEASAAAALTKRACEPAPHLAARRFISPKNDQPTLLGHIVYFNYLGSRHFFRHALMFWFAGTKQNEWFVTSH